MRMWIAVLGNADAVNNSIRISFIYNIIKHVFNFFFLGKLLFNLW
jgi:hypothetical protein